MAKTSDLISQYVEDDPRSPGAGGARLRGYGISVWVLVAHYLGAEEDAGQVAHDYQIPREAVEAALAYYGQHQCAVDARIEQHEAAFR